MQFQLSASNALNKWLKADLPRLPAEQGKQAGVNKLCSDSNTMNWQVHLIDNHYQSCEKTLVVCEVNSRFTYFVPLERPFYTPEALAKTLTIEWQFALVEAIEELGLTNSLDVATLLFDLNEIEFEPNWIKNTDLSVNGHISDAAQWVTQTLDDRNLDRLSPSLAFDIATYLNAQTKSVKVGNKKVRFIPIERLLDYICQITQPNASTSEPSNVIPFPHR